MEIEIKDVTPAIRLAEIENSLPSPKTGNNAYVWIMAIGAIGTGIIIYILHLKKTKKKDVK